MIQWARFNDYKKMSTKDRERCLAFDKSVRPIELEPYPELILREELNEYNKYLLLSEYDDSLSGMNIQEIGQILQGSIILIDNLKSKTIWFEILADWLWYAGFEIIRWNKR